MIQLLVGLINIIMKIIMGLIVYSVCEYFSIELWATIVLMIMAVQSTGMTYEVTYADRLEFRAKKR